MDEDPQRVWSKPHAPGDVAEPKMSQGNWWYQYPSGQWIWWSAEKNEWVPVEVTRSAPTRWWVYALVIVAAVILIATFISALVTQLPEMMDEIERQQGEVNVLGETR